MFQILVVKLRARRFIQSRRKSNMRNIKKTLLDCAENFPGWSHWILPKGLYYVEISTDGY